MKECWQRVSGAVLLGYLYAFRMPSLAELEKSSGIVEVAHIIISNRSTGILHMM